MKVTLVFLFLCFVGITLFAQEPPVVEGKEGNVVKELFFAGLKEKMAENYANANTNFTKIVNIDPKNDAAYFEIATLNFRQNKLLDAEVAIKKAIALKANNVWYLRLQGEIYKRNGNMEALVGVFNQLIVLSPENEDFYYDRANAFFIAGKIPEAKNAYDEIEQRFGSSKELTLAKQRVVLQSATTPTDESINKLIAENPADVKNYLYLSGVLLEKNKKEEALALLQKAKVLEPNNFEIDLAMADIYQSQKKNELAILPLKSAFAQTAMPIASKVKIVSLMLPRFNNQLVVKDATDLTQIALKAHPNDPKLLLLYGDVLYQQGKLNDAKEQYQAVLKVAEQNYLAWEKILGIQTLMGQYTDAIKTGEEALSIYPNQAILYYYRAFALHRNGQNAEAGIEIKSALQLDGDDQNLKAMIFALQAEVLIDQEKLKEADAAFDKAIALAPDNYLTLSNYAYYLALRNQNLSKAETLAAKAAAALPKNASVLDTYAMVLFKLGKYDLALSWIERALQNNEASNPVYLEHYGDILFLKGEKENALLQWQKAKQAGNSSEKLTKKINEKKYIK
ncbi:tetratricopeptide repeat protein [Pedobacter polaris]|uniref:Tetratricopeptide repeat protein n=1 Tax=Pedobacter polaris TaxID=2571273 RepID=A0A4V5P3E8_9SPHI|nr:tetratricopeptide repeat protein [Pedobacter polaris]TKC13102.1 tetratricopeptide repeat protein [Pedobacter polaris]